MDAQEFKKDFLEEVRVNATIDGYGTCASFVSSFSSYMQQVDFIGDFNHAYFEGVGKYNKKIRVDGFSYDDLDKTMNLIIADYDSLEDNRTLSKKQANQIRSRLHNFVSEVKNSDLHKSLEMSRSCWDLVDMIKGTELEIRKFRFLILSNSVISQNIVNLDAEYINETPTECQLWSIERLFKICGSDSGKHIVEIDFKEYTSNGIPCLNASETTTEHFKSFLCIIPGEVLANIYDKYGSQLLEGNVRSFLSTKVSVNKKIRTTIIESPENFFAYNNGISATAMNVVLESTPEGLKLISVKDFQIINGGQTTASLSNARHKDKYDLKKIFVQMKLTVLENIPDDTATKLIQDISRSSNSQNKVSDADFFSTHPFHVRMERCSQYLYARASEGSQFDTKWFYERARGQYFQKQMKLTQAEKKKFLLQNPKNQLVTKTDLAKVRNTWSGFPHIVSRGAQTSFMLFADKMTKEWRSQNDATQFKDKYFQETVALILMFKYLERIIPTQPWYSQGYRANIITYTIALFNHLIKEQFNDRSLDLLSIWARQTVPDVIQKDLTDLSEKVYNKITDPLRNVENVTQWCKREDCWLSVLNIRHNLSIKIEIFLSNSCE